MIKKAFITCISGQDGSYLTELLLEKDYEVYGIIRRHSVAENQDNRLTHLIGQGVETEYGDLLDVSSLEKMITNAVFEIIVGIKIDNEFGPTIILGAGGIYTELFKDTTTLLLPLNKKIILEELKKLKFGKILFGFRGKKAADLDALVNTILKIAKFADKNSNKISEVDINPLIVCKKGKGVFAVDALIHYFK